MTIRTRRGRLAQINTIRRAAYGYDQRFEVLGSKGMLQAGNHRPTEVTLWSSGADHAPTSRSISSSSAIARRTRPRWRISSTCVAGTRGAAHVDRRRRQGAGAGRSRDDVLAREAHRRHAGETAMTMPRLRVGIAGLGPHGPAPRAKTSRAACRSAELVAACSPVADELAWAERELGVAQLLHRLCGDARAARTSTRCSSSRRRRCTRSRSSTRCARASTCSPKSRCRSTSPNASASRRKPRCSPTSR